MPSQLLTSGLDALFPNQPIGSIDSWVERIDQGLRTFGFDLQTLFKGFDLKTAGLLAMIAFVGIILFDILGVFSTVIGRSSNYAPIGKSLALTAARTWENNKLEILNDPYLKGRSLQPVVSVLDALSNAVNKWEDIQTNDISEEPIYSNNKWDSLHSADVLYSTPSDAIRFSDGGNASGFAPQQRTENKVVFNDSERPKRNPVNRREGSNRVVFSS